MRKVALPERLTIVSSRRHKAQLNPRHTLNVSINARRSNQEASGGPVNQLRDVQTDPKGATTLSMSTRETGSSDLSLNTGGEERQMIMMMITPFKGLKALKV